MHIVVIPILFLIAVGTIKKIPRIGGNLVAAFLGAGIIAMFMGGIYNPIHWISPWIKGLNQISFIIWIIIFGSIFSLLQIRSGAMETVINVLRALFGSTPQGLVFAILITLYIGGSLVGTVAAVGAVIGLLVVPILDDMGLSPELICATIVTGGSMGAIMPPISNAFNVGAGLIGVPLEPVIQIGYVSIGISLVLVSFIFLKLYIGKKYTIPQHLIPKETAGQILKANWKTLIPLITLIVLVMLKSIPAINFDLPGWILKQIPLGDSNLHAKISSVKILGTITNYIVLSLITVCVISFCLYEDARKNVAAILTEGTKTVLGTLFIQIAAAFLLGAFASAGQMEAIAEWTNGMSPNIIKLGGSFAMTLAGMLLGSQSTSQNLLTPIVGPAWIASGVEPVKAAVASAHIAAAGQGLPPADLNTFVIAGLVSSILHKKVDPLKSMYYTAFYCFILLIGGLIFLYI